MNARSALALLAVAGVLSAGPARSQTAERSLTCDREAAEALNPVQLEPTTAAYSQAQRACWIDWTQAQDAVRAQGFQWIDVRDAGTRRQLLLPGVTAVDSAELQDKAFLKGQPVILIGTGVDLHALSSQCATLRASGSYQDIRVLVGGARTWRQLGQPVQVTGNLLAPDEVSAQELWLGSFSDQWQIAAVGLSETEVSQLPAVPALVEPSTDPLRAIQRLRDSAAIPLSIHKQWLVVTSSDEVLGRLRTLWQEQASAASAPPPSQPVWLTGGWSAYASYLQQQKSLAAHAGRSLPRLCGM